MKTVTLLGSTGSVGVNTLRVLRAAGGRFRVRGLAASSQSEALAEQAKEFGPEAVFLRDPEEAARLGGRLGGGVRIFSEREGLAAFAAFLQSDILVAASSGTSALEAVLEALRAGKKVALANKEILVVAGPLVMTAARSHPSAALIPVDSEHNAIFQCLQGARPGEVERLLLTGSGGPLRGVPEERFDRLSVEEVVNHPKWRMGRKISVDSATMMNKGLEIIEARWLFGLPVDKIEVLVHPEAVVHSMVEFKDGAILAQLGVTDMRLPILHALDYPERCAAEASLRLNLERLGTLTFAPPDRKKFPCLNLAVSAAKQAGSAPCVLSAADEVAVRAFLDSRIVFTRIPAIIESVLAKHRHVADPDLEEIRSIHEWAVEETSRLCQTC